MNNILLVVLSLISQQKVVTQETIWIGDPTTINSPLKAITVQALTFYDDQNNLRLIILKSPGPSPTPPVPDVPGPPPPGKYNVAPATYANVNKYLQASVITKEQIASMAKAYREASYNINATIAGVGTMTRKDAQNLIITKTHEALGNNLTAWQPILDSIISHMKTISMRLTTAKALSEYYLEIATAFEAID